MDRRRHYENPQQTQSSSSGRRRHFTPQYSFGTSSRNDATLRNIERENERDRRLDRTLDAIPRRRHRQNQRTSHNTARPLLDSFRQYFPASVDYIQGCGPAEQWITEAARQGANFRGYAEDGPRSNTESYILDMDVYVPRAHQTDPILAMKDFLFELKNGVNAPEFNAVLQEASQRAISPETYARKQAQMELEGAWDLAELWTQMKPHIARISNNSIDLDAYDDTFYLTERQWYENEGYSKDQILEAKLNTVYQSGRYAEMTVRDFYMLQYEGLHSQETDPENA